MEITRQAALAAAESILRTHGPEPGPARYRGIPVPTGPSPSPPPRPAARRAASGVTDVLWDVVYLAWCVWRNVYLRIFALVVLLFVGVVGALIASVALLVALR